MNIWTILCQVGKNSNQLYRLSVYFLSHSIQYHYATISHNIAQQIAIVFFTRFYICSSTFILVLFQSYLYLLVLFSQASTNCKKETRWFDFEWKLSWICVCIDDERGNQFIFFHFSPFSFYSFFCNDFLLFNLSCTLSSLFHTLEFYQFPTKLLIVHAIIIICGV